MNDIAFGGWMTLVGMGTVIGLLFVLMMILRLIGWADQPGSRKAQPTDPEADAADAEPSEIEAVTEAGPLVFPDGLTEEQVAAITIAVITHARVRRSQAAPAMREVPPGSQLFASRWVSVGRAYQNQPWKPR